MMVGGGGAARSLSGSIEDAVPAVQTKSASLVDRPMIPFTGMTSLCKVVDTVVANHVLA